MRELLATPPRLGVSGLIAVALLFVVGALVARWFWRRGASEWAVVATAGAIGLSAAIVVLRMRSPGAPTIGWPIVWAVPLLPYRALGLPLDPDIAFGVGLTLSLLAIAATVRWIDILGRWATGRASVGLLAAACFALWPLLSSLLADIHGEARGTWQGEVGLSLYPEPLSTLLVLVAMALVIRPGSTAPQIALAGALLGFSVAARLSNVVLVALALALLVRRLGSRKAAPFVVACAAFAPLVLAYWPKGYPQYPAEWFDDPFALRYISHAWTDSVLWTPRALLVLLLPAFIGSWIVLGRWRIVLLWGWILTTAALYSLFRFTPLHPRLLFVTMPAVLVLWSAGLVRLGDALERLRLRRARGA
jgi:hypothetical protein